MNSSQMNLRTDAEVAQPPAPSEEEVRTRNLAEILSYAPTLKFYGEVGVVFFLYFQLLYIQIAYEFPTSVALLPLIIYNAIQIWYSGSAYFYANTTEEKPKQVHIIINWTTTLFYLVFF